MHSSDASLLFRAPGKPCTFSMLCSYGVVVPLTFALSGYISWGLLWTGLVLGTSWLAAWVELEFGVYPQLDVGFCCFPD